MASNHFGVNVTEKQCHIRAKKRTKFFLLWIFVDRPVRELCQLSSSLWLPCWWQVNKMFVCIKFLGNKSLGFGFKARKPPQKFEVETGLLRKLLKWPQKIVHSLKIPFYKSSLPIHLILTVIKFVSFDAKTCLNCYYYVFNSLCFGFLVFPVNLTNASQLISTNKLWCFVHIVVVSITII